MNHKFRAKPIYDSGILSDWQVVSNPQRFSVEQFKLLLNIADSGLSKHGISWCEIKQIDHRDKTVTIAAPAHAWQKAAHVIKAEEKL